MSNKSTHQQKVDIHPGKSDQMTLRDHFAIAALQNMSLKESCSNRRAEIAAVTAYQIADAMLHVREQ